MDEIILTSRRPLKYSVTFETDAMNCAEIDRLCRTLHITHSELINRMITAFSRQDADSLSVLLNAGRKLPGK